MLPPSIATQTVTVLEPVLVSDHGVSVPDYAAAPALTTVVTGCSVQPAYGTEDDANRRADQVLYTVWMPPGSPVTALSRLLIPGRALPLQVVAEPLVWNTGSSLDHLQVDLTDWEG